MSSKTREMEAYIDHLESKEESLRARLQELGDWSAHAAGEIVRLRAALRHLAKLSESVPRDLPSSLIAKQTLAQTTFEPQLGREYTMNRINELIEKWKGAKISVRATNDPELLAGCYLEWAGGDLPRAIRAVGTHCSGQYIDMPPFHGCMETLALLKGLDE